MAWISPTNHVDYGAWNNEANAYNGNTGDAANESVPKNSWGGFLALTHAEINCDKVQFYAKYEAANINKIDLDVYWDGAWHDIYEGSYASEEWVEKPLGDTYAVTQARVKFYNDNDFASWICYLYEFEFNEVEAGEEKLLTATSSVTSSITGSLTLGKIESLTAASATAINVPSTTLQLLYSITARAPPVTAIAGSLSVVKSLSGTSSTASAISGSLALGKVESLSGTSSTTSSLSASITLTWSVSGTAQIGSSIQGSLGVIKTLTGTASGVSNTQGSLTVLRIIFLSGTASVVFSTQGFLAICKALSALAEPSSEILVALSVIFTCTAIIDIRTNTLGNLAILMERLEAPIKGIIRESAPIGVPTKEDAPTGMPTKESVPSGVVTRENAPNGVPERMEKP